MVPGEIKCLASYPNGSSVDNRDYHHLSQSEMGGGRGISRHLSERPGCLSMARAIHRVLRTLKC